MRFVLSLLALAAIPTFGSQINVNITGTCGFYQGTPGNVVYSETFTGDGTFCTGFESGGSFTYSGAFSFGDQLVSAYNDLFAVAPAGYGAFVQFNDVITLTQQYLITPSGPSTPTGYVGGFFESGPGYTDDGSGTGYCTTGVGMTFDGVTGPDGGAHFLVPTDFTTPISSVQTIYVTCNEYGTKFGDEGLATLGFSGPQLYDSNMNLIGENVVTIPEPSSFGLMALGLALLGRKMVRS